MPTQYAVNFEATISVYDYNRYVYSAIYFPAKIRDQLKLRDNPRLRVTGEISGAPFDGACQPAGDNKWYLMLSKKFMKSQQWETGDRVQVRLNIADQNAVDVPRELELALNADEQARAAWEAATPGRRRGLAYRVASAKRAATRETRTEEVIEELRGG